MATKKPKKTTTKPTASKSKKPKSGKRGTSSWIKAIVLAICILLIFRLFIFQSFVIQSSSMAGNLLPGDWVVINKAAYGCRIPITPLSVPFAPSRTSQASEKYFIDWIQLPYFRLPGYTEIKNNDIIAFNYPEEEDIPVDKKVLYVKRCAGTPGDTIKLVNNQLFINGDDIAVENIEFEYRVKTKGKSLKKEVIEKFGLNEGGQINNFGEYYLYLTPSQADELKNEKGIVKVEKEKKLRNANKSYVFPHDEKFNWTLENYGPLVIPREGAQIKLTRKNISLYRKIIETFEGDSISINHDSIFVNNKLSDVYHFHNNYYFVLDDNRDNAKDSRLWGFLPESHIVGKVSFVITSFNPSASGFKKIRWGRTCKNVR